MNLTIAHRDSPLEESYLRNVSTFIVMGQELMVLFCDGTRRNYPLVNIRWYGETPDPHWQTQQPNQLCGTPRNLWRDALVESDDAVDYPFRNPFADLDTLGPY